MKPTNVISISLYNAEILNSNQRLHHQVKAHRASHIRGTALFLAQAQRVAPMEKAHCYVWISFNDRRRRDPNNYWETVKPAIDGIVDAGLLEDDDSKHLIGPDMRLDEINSTGQVIFRFEFFEVA